MRWRSRSVNRLKDAADALYARHATDHDCLADCQEADDYGEWCECDPLDGIQSRIAQTVRRVMWAAYFRWTDDHLIHNLFVGDEVMERTDTPMLSWLRRQQDGMS